MSEPSETAKAVVAMMAVALKEFEALYDGWTSRDTARLRYVAIELCKADGRGNRDPFLVVMGAEHQPQTFGAKSTVCFAMPIQPQWALYLSQAQTAIDAVRVADRDILTG